MPDLTLIILSAGNSSRFELEVKKQWIVIDDKPLWKYVAKKLSSFAKFKDIIITATPKEINYMKKYANYKFVIGGDSRQESLKNALKHVNTPYTLVTDVARACITEKMIDRLIHSKDSADIIVPYLQVDDTVVYENETINRDKIKLIQTPQLSKSEILQKALQQDEIFTDDSSAIKAIGGTVYYVKGSTKAKKITRYDDLSLLECLQEPQDTTFVGTGFDVHPFCKDKKMFLGGVLIDSDFGFLAHSDGDVLLHALIDALLGAIGAGDIGELFPDSDKKYKNIDSKILLQEVVTFIKEVGYIINNIDITIIAETPRLSNYKTNIRDSISSILKIEPIRVNIKATTTEKLGFIGRKEGVAVYASATIKYFNWKRT